MQKAISKAPFSVKHIVQIHFFQMYCTTMKKLLNQKWYIYKTALSTLDIEVILSQHKFLIWSKTASQN